MATGIGGFDPRTVQPVASRYTDWAIPAHMQLHIKSILKSRLWEYNCDWRSVCLFVYSYSTTRCLTVRLSTVCWTTLSESRNTQRWTVAWSVDNELLQMYREAVIV
jgi:hypothetical protein